MQGYEVLFFEKADGTEPAKEFLLGLDKKMRAKMFVAIDMLVCNGPELRAKVGSDISRVLYFFVVGRRAILTNGFVKKTQKTPSAELERAKRYRREYLSKEGKEP